MKQPNKDRLEFIAKDRRADFGNIGLEEVREMALSLLAIMAQKPVGITDRSEIECLLRGEMANVMPTDYEGVDKGDEVYLYTEAPVLTESWIPCNERMPETLEWVIANDEVGAVKAYVCEHSGLWIRDNGDDLYAVTHWQPLPTPPKEEEC